MKVSELIEELKKMPQDSLVYRDGSMSLIQYIISAQFYGDDEWVVGVVIS